MGRVDYKKADLTGRQVIITVIQSIFLVGVATVFLYREAWGVVLLSPLGVWWFIVRKRDILEKRRQLLAQQFKEMLLAVVTCLQAGYSVENAFVGAKEDMEKLYGKESDIVRELGLLEHAITNRIPVEQVLKDFGNRSGVREIRDFGQVFAIGKRSGADMGDMIGNTVQLIGDKLETFREIRTVMGAKIMEQRVMSLVPFGIMIYINLTSPGFFGGLYHNLFGMIFMTICLMLYLAALILAQKIVHIEV